VHDIQLLQVPSMHVRVCTPHNPHDWLDGPMHDWPSGEPPVGCTTGVGSDDHAPQSGTDSSLDAQAVVRTTVAPLAAVPHAPEGNCSCEPFDVQSVPSLNTTQHAFSPHTPAAPAGNWRATFRSAPFAPGASVAVQFERLTVAGIAVAKQSWTSKHPPGGLASRPATTPPSPVPPTLPGT
jgi:hypothetical protein